ncbi:hypothetical protein BpHYR1_042519, partial [Brachionus plicatilis]
MDYKKKIKHICNLLILSDRKVYTSAALSSEAAPGLGGFVQSSSNTENAFGTLAAQNQSGSLFSSFT